MQMDKIVERYVALRDKKAEMDAAHKANVADVVAAMDRLENAILESLNNQGVESVRTAFGTAMKIKSTSATVADWDMLLGYIQSNERWDMLEKRVNKTAVDQFRAANDDLPPGVNYKEAITIGVRRSAS